MSGGIDLGDAWINVVPSFKGMGKSIAAEVSGFEQTINSSAKGWGSTIASHLGGAFKTVGALAGISLTAAAGFIASYTGEALAASDATDKFKSTLDFAGLDSSAISALTKSTQAYADKTVYDLSDIQNITAQLASNGVAGFDKLAEAAGNLNAVAGGNAETFKSVGLVVTQTAGAGKLMTENWRQLTDAIPGVSGPLKQAMLDQGAFTGSINDFQKAMENGEITADEFNQAIMSLGMDQAAIEAAQSTQTFEGAFGNLKAAVEKVGVSFMNAFGPAVTGVMTKLADSITAMGEKIQPMLDQLSQPGGLDGFKDKLGGLAPVIGVVGGMLGPLLANIPMLGGAFAGLTGPVGLVMGLFAGMMSNSDAFAGSIGGLFSALGSSLPGFLPIIQQAIGALGGFMGDLGDAIAPIIDSLAQSFQQIMPVVQQVVAALITSLAPVLPMIASAIGTVGGIIADLMPYVTEVVNLIMGSVVPLLPMVGQLIGQVVTAIQGILVVLKPVIMWIVQSVVGLVQAIMPSIQAFVGFIITAVSGVIQIIQGVIDFIVGVFTGNWQMAWDGIKGIFEGVWNAIVGFFGAIGAAFSAIFQAFIAVIVAIWNRAWNLISSFFTGVWNVITGALSAALGTIQGAISGALSFISGLWNSAWSGVSSFVSNTWNNVTSAVSNGVSSMMSFISGIPGQIKGFFADAGSWLVDAGRNIIDGFVNGIKNVFGKVKDTLGSLTALLPDWKGPATLDRVILRENGRLVIQGFQKGLEESYQGVHRSLTGFTNDLSATPALAGAVSSGNAPSTPVFNIVARVVNPFTGEEIEAKVADQTIRLLAQI